MKPDVLCIGSVLWDVVGRPHEGVAHRLGPGADLPGRIVQAPGGVALNVAAALARLGRHPALLGAVGRDGEALVERCAAMGLVVEHLFHGDAPTDRFVAIEGPGGVLAAIADTRALDAAGARILDSLRDGRIVRPWRGPVVLDGNLAEALLAEIAGSAFLIGADLRVAPASPGKAARLGRLLGHSSAVLYLNLEEASVLAGRVFDRAAEAAAALLAKGAARAIVTNGPRAAADGTKAGVIEAAPREVSARRVLGAGDAFTAAHVAAEMGGADRPAALGAALAAAADHVAGAA